MEPVNVVLCLFGLAAIMLVTFFLFLVAVLVVALSADSVLSRFGIEWLNDKERQNVPKSKETPAQSKYRDTGSRPELDDMFNNPEGETKDVIEKTNRGSKDA